MTQIIIPIVQVDAFADAPFGGNPAAVMPLDAWLDDAVLQAIAAENNLSETAFYLPDATGEADFELRWFTPTTEVAMCGHATLATGHVVLGQSEADAVSFRTRKAGVLHVTRDGDGYALDLPVTRVERRDNAALLAALGCDGEVYESISGAEETAIVLLDSEAAAARAHPRHARAGHDRADGDRHRSG